MWNNPIIRKELLETAHRRRTYLVRAGLPMFGAAILLPQLIHVLRYAPRDWRTVSNIARPLFVTTMWLEFGAFSLLSKLTTTFRRGHGFSIHMIYKFLT